MAKIKKTTQPKKSVRKTVKNSVKKAVTPVVKTAGEAKKPVFNQLKKINLVPLVIFLIGVFILVFLFLFARKNLIVASINGQPLTRFEVIKTLEKQGGKQIVDNLVSEILLTQKAEKENIEVTDQEIEAEIKKIEKQLKEQNTDLATALAAQGWTQEDLEKNLEKDREFKLLLDKLFADKTKVTDKEVNKYLEENRASFPEGMTDKELKKSIREQLESQKLSSAAQELLGQLKEEANIKYYINY